METELLKGHLERSGRPLFVVLGPTASGKTAFSLRLARKLQRLGRRAEVISADSRQLYRYLDIGTAKIREEEMEGIPHHLLSVLDPKEQVTVGWYKDQAIASIDAVLTRRNVPILVGGSMLYLSAIIAGLEFLPKADASLRSFLAAAYDDDGGKALFEKLRRIDPETASKIHPRNKAYLIRALEIHAVTAVPPSRAKAKRPSPYDLCILGMRLPREELREKIARRVDLLFERGWVREVSGLLERGYEAADPGMRSHGYREICHFLKEGKESKEGGLQTKNYTLKTGEGRLEALKRRIAERTSQYAKRQITWWRNDERIQWIPPLPSLSPGERVG